MTSTTFNLAIFSPDVADLDTRKHKDLGLLEKLRKITGASIAASKTLTGNAEKGGNWNLEVKLGKIGSSVIISHNIQLSYQGVLGAGDLDTSFNGTGIVTTSFDVFDNCKAMIIDSSGKILMAGIAYFRSYPPRIGLARYNSDGSFDTTFGLDGQVATGFGGSDMANAMTVDSSGKILVAGYTNINNGSYDFALMRYNSDGSLDNTFDSDGIVTNEINGNDIANAITIDSSGKILVAGTTGYMNHDITLVRYNSNGSLDTTFGIGGIVATDFGSNSDEGKAMTIDSNGKILLAGSANGNFALVRYNSDGSLDTTFGNSGKVTTDFGSNSDEGKAMTIDDSNGKILLAGSANGNFALVRYNSDGSLDTTFGNNSGKVTTDFGTNSDEGNAVAIDSSGKIVMVGSSGIARYNSDGSLDTTFAPDGKVRMEISLDSPEDFGFPYYLTTIRNNGRAMSIDSSGKILVAGDIVVNGYGDTDFALFRYGTPDVAITTPTVAPATVGPGNTNKLIYQIDLAVTGSWDTKLIDLTLTTGGTYQSGDVDNFKLWYSADHIFDAGDTQLSRFKRISSDGSMAAIGFQPITRGTTGYLFVTADIAASPTDGNTINIAPLSLDNIIFDSATKTGTPIASNNLTIDALGPDVALTSTSAATVNAPFTVTATFSEDVKDFEIDDISVGNGTVGNFIPIDAKTYTFDITPTADGNVSVDIPSSVATDNVGNDNTAATQLTRTYTYGNTGKPGVFTVGSDGQINLDFINDSGLYQGEMGIFSLEGMENLTPGSEEYIKEAARRAATKSELGYVAISDRFEGAKFNPSVGETPNRNFGEYLGFKTFTMKPNSQFALMLVPNGTVEELVNNPTLTGDRLPLFSTGPNPEQLVDLTKKGNTFVWEDLDVKNSPWRDFDYNDIIFQINGATVSEIGQVDDFINPALDWRNSPEGKALFDYANSNPMTKPSDENIPFTGAIPQTERTLQGAVDEGNVVDATVFLDTNKNGELDANEPSGTTDENGIFAITVDVAQFDTNNSGDIETSEGNLVAIGGTDKTTGELVETPLTAPVDAVEINALTTLVTEILDRAPTPANPKDETVAKQVVEAQVKENLGLSATSELTTPEPNQGIVPVESVETSQKSAQVANAIAQTVELIEEATTAPKATIVESAVKAIATQIENNTPVIFTNEEQVKELIVASATETKASDPNLDLNQVTEQLAETAKAIVQTNLVVAGQAPTIVETPTTVVETPTAVVETPTTVVETPTAVVETPTTVVETPTTVVETPTTVVEKPTAVVETPTAIVETPTAVVETPIAQPGPIVFPPLPPDPLPSVSTATTPTPEPTVSSTVPLPSMPIALPSPHSTDVYINIINPITEGTDESENFEGTNSDDIIYGQGGNDNIFGQAGQDQLSGNQGDDYIDGGADDDLIYGGKGKDQVIGGDGNDLISGNNDDDLLIGDAGDDIIYGGKENDQIWGGTGNDELTGDLGDDRINGEAGKDLLLGNEGDDLLLGGDDDDILIGGPGNNTLAGEAGNDTFVLSNDGIATILDFTVGDLVKLPEGISANNISLIPLSNSLEIQQGNQTLAVFKGMTQIDLASFI